ncbi:MULTISPECIES: FAD-dependent oxidoreductase [Pseudomonadota]|uniref:Pyridine nucleotide-disulfide oxidoreductase n=1 Tax=Stutzerimonas stutzeri TaxID=316 RepID=A0A2N8SZ96_STUST|nr:MULTISPECIES: FAD-dependent oxidoreductase [Pseudomonadota]KWT88541.1 Ferredoxin reductase [Variovorax sp. WDL1]MCQ4249809.1 FAD-dependent oxidoreductase [Stutzerimonas stutzeri]PNG07805.1 pyridine nucleotide-disulfide oxidoreductase [Stutzerimonas stutzeri]PNG59697.1 Benzene 1,2-dioxygenase system ferredoxin--NAD(+) reductase subunit [Variovorax sp. B4]PNG60512.1 Benzene 1,2-dioxygenase system ferredoxin--NAD(+) reductase subunit [Variovorax sp. B2]
MSLQEIDFLLIGGGLASAHAAETLRQEGATGSVQILSAEPTLPYHRPFLSKRYLLGTVNETRILVHPEDFYREHRIEVTLGTRAVGIDTAKQWLRTSKGSLIHYGKLLIATGSIPRALVVPGATLGGVYTLRTQADSEAIRHAAAGARRVAVIGGGFLGMEVALSMRELGLSVVVIEAQDRILRHLESAVLSDFVRHQVELAHGISVMTTESVVAFHGRKSIKEVETANGARVACDLAIICIGVEPATGFLKDSGLQLENGYVVVDERLQASAPNVYAAGDVASFYDPVFAQRRHIEHWDNAIKQGQLAARNMFGRRRRYDEVSCFFCEIGDVGFNVVGDPSCADETVSQGSLKDRSFSIYYLNNGIPRAVFMLGRPPDEIRAAESLIRYRTNLRKDKRRLEDPAFALQSLPMQNVLILQGGGALGAFECGVVKALEELQIFPDIVAGISIGAFNGAIVASHPEQATEALEAFWADIQVASPMAPTEQMRHALTAAQIVSFGMEKFFRPRWMPSLYAPWEAFLQTPWNWISFYDTSPMRRLLAQYVDFPALRRSPVRLLVGAVNVLTAEFETFDSYVDDLTPDHIIASGSLPPGFAWTFVDGNPYWDGGIVSNSPLDLVIDRCGPDGKRVFIVDLFASQRELPTNITEVLARRDEIIYAERVRSDLHVREMAEAYRDLIDHLMQEIGSDQRDRIKRLPRYIQLMGNGVSTQITRFMRKPPPDELPSRDYDFSDLAIRNNQAQGYALAKSTLALPDSAGGHRQRVQAEHARNSYPHAGFA